METLKRLKAGELIGDYTLSLGCGLTEFPREIFDLADTLEILNMTDNNLSTLPDDFGRLKNLKILFLSNNQFQEVPKVLSQCPKLSMVGFKKNKISSFAEDTLPHTVRWLILTDNKIEKLPNSLGDLKYLQKLMLAGNHIKELPDTLVNCKNLELFRISANQLNDIPLWLFKLPKLSWFAYAGNPFCSKHPACDEPLEVIDWKDLKIEKLLGEGASGLIYKAIWEKEDKELEVAIKEFKGDMTSDGLPKEEMDINIAIGHHDNLIDVLAKVKNHPQNRDALILELIPPDFFNLGLPPNFQTCTRDTYHDGYTLTLSQIITLLKGVVSASKHIHDKGIMHGDFYAHNILINKKGESLLGDFGGASYYEPEDEFTRVSLERLEVRAFGYLVEEMLILCDDSDLENYANPVNRLTHLRDICLEIEISKRPLFETIEQYLKQINI